MKHYSLNQHLIITSYSQNMSHDVTQCNLYIPPDPGFLQYTAENRLPQRN